MSTTLPATEDFMLSHWNSFVDLFDQSSSSFENSDINWSGSGLEDCAQDFSRTPQNAMSLVYGGQHISNGLSPYHSNDTSDGSQTSTSDVAKQAEEGKARKRIKGRPKVNRKKGDPTAIERRRTQVRLAQQAYRHRKEATIVSLREDIEGLKGRLIHAGSLFDEFYEAAMRSNLPKEERKVFRQIYSDAEHYRLRREQSTIDDTNRKNDSSGNPSAAHKHETFNAGDVQDVTKNHDVQVENVSAEYPIRLLKQFQSPPSINKSLGSVGQAEQQYENIPPSVGFPPFDELAPVPLPFSYQFSHVALRQGYNLITKQSTSYSDLCRAFRYCIFSSTRDGIARRLHYLLHESAKRTYQAFASVTKTDGNSSWDFGYLDGPVTSSASLTAMSSQDFSISEAGDEITTRRRQEIEDGYIDAEGVENYLAERGLSIAPGSTVVTFPPNPRSASGQNLTLFDEIRGKRELQLSVSRLLYELLDRVVCLEMGPGLKTPDIDEAIRSTVIAAI